MFQPTEKREYLVKNVKGLGLKEASHFLRNIGHNNLAILDRHILKNLHKLGVIEEVPRSLTKKAYLDIEEKFKRFSKKIGITMDELDLLFWSMETGKVFK
jgi:N-glycosylase/DNA lyase